MNQTARRYAAEFGTVTYEISGSVASGEETMRFADYGAIEAKETRLTISTNGTEQAFRQLTILRDGQIYSIDLMAGRGTKMPDVMSSRLIAQYGNDKFGSLGSEIMRAMGGREVGPGNVLNQDCVLWEVPSIGSTTCLAQGVPLSAEAKLGDAGITYTATSVDFDTEVTAEAFAVPAGITITETPAPTDLSLPSS